MAGPCDHRSSAPQASRAVGAWRRLALLLPALAASGVSGAHAQEPVRCVSLNSIDRTEVIDDRTIAFFLTGGRVYLNRLDRACPNLSRDRGFSYSTSTRQLCSVDVITVLENFAGGLNRGATCGLGEFEPSDEEEIEILRGERDVVEVRVEEIEVEEGAAEPGEAEETPESRSR